jgi:hypothetical protein
LPAEITDAQVTSGVGTDEVLMTPTKLKTAIVAHAPSGGDTLPLPLFTIGVLSQTPELPQLPTSQVTVVPPLVSIVTPPL